MIGWIILGCILTLIILLLSASLKFFFSVSDSVTFTIKYLFFTLFSFDSSKEEAPDNKEVKNEPPPAAQNKKSSLKEILKKYSEGKKKPELILELIEFFKNLLIKLKKLICRMRFHGFNLYLSIGSDEAATTAVTYGAACSAIYPLITLLSSAKNFSAEKVTVKTDFASDKTVFSSSGQVSVRLVYILTFLASVAFFIIKNKIGDLKNGRK